LTTKEITSNHLNIDTDFHTKFEEFLKKNGLRLTKQRAVILDAILTSPNHIDADTVLEKARTADKTVGLATVYRTLQVLTESGILNECAFNKERAIFEISQDAKHHHDHLICEKCGTIVEFHDEEIELLQKRIALRLGFELTNHNMVLYGKCIDKNKCKLRFAEKKN